MRIELEFDAPQEEFDAAVETAAKGNAEPLRSLCRKEVESFEQYLKASDPQFREGLAKFERMSIEGYLYQKLRGHLDAKKSQPGLPTERQDGAQAST